MRGGFLIRASKGIASDGREGPFKSVLESNKHIDAIKSSFENLANTAYARLTPPIYNFSLIYDQITGRQTVRQAGIDLLQAEKDFVESQLRRRTSQEKLFEVQKKRTEINKQLDFISRADEAFLPLITKEHELARVEAELLLQHNDTDRIERSSYEKFATLLRYLHAEERNYDMRMRQWALLGSISVGFFSAFVTWLRFRTPKLDIEEFRAGIAKLDNSLLVQNEINEILKKLPLTISESVKGNLEAVVSSSTYTPPAASSQLETIESENPVSKKHLQWETVSLYYLSAACALCLAYCVICRWP